MSKQTLGLLALTIWIISACTLRLGSRPRLMDAPAPTTIPLENASEAETPAGLTPPQKPLYLPSGFVVNLFAVGLNGPRMLAIGPDGKVYAAERGANRVVRLDDLDGDGEAEATVVVAEGLQRPNSLAFYQDGSLYVGGVTRIFRLSQPDAQGVFQEKEILIDGLPDGGHITRTVLFSPDFRSLFVSVGSSCNVCDEADPRRAAIVRYNPDGSGEAIHARGLRNAVGITFRPGTEELWATNNGRDMLGDDLPPDTVDLVNQEDDFGWPRCHSGRIVDPEFGKGQACAGVALPQVELQAHSAPLGLTFYNGAQFPLEYRGGLFVAFHGSWNRSAPTGYKVIFIPFTNGKSGPVQDFAIGWLANGVAWGRPVDVVQAQDGSLLVSDDSSGAIYRISYPGGN